MSCGGPTEAQQRYEPPSDLAAKLGNVHPGDGFRYRGRGPIQLTGRANYVKYGRWLGVDLESDPDLAELPHVAFLTAALYWANHGLNDMADIREFIMITKAINGGINGLADRQRYYLTAKRVLGVE